MRVLVVGAGAVGQVYASFLVAGGAEVAFKVRDPARVARPFRIYPLRGDRTARSFDVPALGTTSEVAAFAPDLVLLTVPSDALDGPWLGELLAATGAASVVSLEPHVEDSDKIRAAKPDVELTLGVIALIAYHAPLPGEVGFDPPGVALYLPPFTSMPFDGPAAAKIADVLNRGGMPAAVRTGLGGPSAFGSAVMGAYVTALRAAGWSFAALDPELLRTTNHAVAEAHEVIAQRLGRSAPAGLWFVGPRTVPLGLWLGAKILPLPLETYLRVHFTKVGAQTKASLEHLVAAGEAQGRPMASMRELLTRAWATPR